MLDNREGEVIALKEGKIVGIKIGDIITDTETGDPMCAAAEFPEN